VAPMQRQFPEGIYRRFDIRLLPEKNSVTKSRTIP
jgi:hypothetical protein